MDVKKCGSRNLEIFTSIQSIGLHWRRVLRWRRKEWKWNQNGSVDGRRCEEYVFVRRVSGSCVWLWDYILLYTHHLVNFRVLKKIARIRSPWWNYSRPGWRWQQVMDYPRASFVVSLFLVGDVVGGLAGRWGPRALIPWWLLWMANRRILLFWMSPDTVPCRVLPGFVGVRQTLWRMRMFRSGGRTRGRHVELLEESGFAFALLMLIVPRTGTGRLIIFILIEAVIYVTPACCCISGRRECIVVERRNHDQVSRNFSKRWRRWLGGEGIYWRVWLQYITVRGSDKMN